MTPIETVTFGFPFEVDRSGGIGVDRADDALRAKIIQVLLTSPGERVHQPEFGCGLLDLVFEPDDDVLAAALEFGIGQALTRWLRADIVVDGVEVRAENELIRVEISYTPRAEKVPQALRVSFR